MQILRLFTVVAVCSVPGALGSEVSGRVKLVQGSADRKPMIVVYAEQLGEHEPPKPGHYDLKQHSKTFIPHVLPIPVGSTVTFPNDDPIFHNVFSLSRPGPFDLGLYRAGDSKTRVFNKPAVYRVFCNIHPQMSALLLVLPTSFITETDAQGNYRINLPPGDYQLSAWSERSDPVTKEISVQAAPLNVPEITLDESKFVELQHKNKYGQDYPASAYEPGKR